MLKFFLVFYTMPREDNIFGMNVSIQSKNVVPPWKKENWGNFVNFLEFCKNDFLSVIVGKIGWILQKRFSKKNLFGQKNHFQEL